jgi:hypothetical protein
MKPLWVQTALWIVAVLAAVLMALAAPDIESEFSLPQGASVPR